LAAKKEIDKIKIELRDQVQEQKKEKEAIDTVVERVDGLVVQLEDTVNENKELKTQQEDLLFEIQRLKREFRTQSLYTAKDPTPSQIISSGSFNITKAFWE